MQWLASERGPRLKHPNANVESTERGVDYLGYHVRRKGVFPLSATLRRFERRVAETTGINADEDVDRVVASFRGVLMFPHSLKGWARPRHADLPVDFEVLPEEQEGTEWSPDSG